MSILSFLILEIFLLPCNQVTSTLCSNNCHHLLCKICHKPESHMTPVLEATAPPSPWDMQMHQSSLQAYSCSHLHISRRHVLSLQEMVSCPLLKFSLFLSPPSPSTLIPCLLKKIRWPPLYINHRWHLKLQGTSSIEAGDPSSRKGIPRQVKPCSLC